MPETIGINLRVTGHCNQGGRKYMEDFFSICYQQSEDEKDLEYAFFGIYDGHGGSEAATFAKDHLMNSIVTQKLFWSDSDQDILRAIREGYISTHYAMWREQGKWTKTATGLPSTAGTTASIAFIRRGKIYIGHVGDSGIVLGYQEEGEKFWRARPLTHDHKPECTVEKNRIIKAGGKVVTKSGVARVVWNRPRLGHQGPVTRSTPFDEIPFLAVARSLGDLWSYNSVLNQFVVSPDPDVKVIRIDPKTFRCLIFGTDGLWNAVSPTDAVQVVRDTETINNKLLLFGSKKWTSPSKCLVEKALQRWSMKRLRADNTTVVTVMLDPPGPPKKEMLNNHCKFDYPSEDCHSNDNFDVIQSDNFTRIERNRFVSPYIDVDDRESFVSLLEDFVTDDSSITITPKIESVHSVTTAPPPTTATVMNYTTNGLQLPTNGYAIMTRYEDNCDNNISFYGSNHHDNSNDMMMMNSTSCDMINNSTDTSINEINYMNSFAESYNSLLVSSFDHGNDEHNNRYLDEVMITENHTNGNVQPANDRDEQEHQQHQHQQKQYQQQCMSTEEGYSLTKLETRGEQQLNSLRDYNTNNHCQIIPVPAYDTFVDDHLSYQYESISSTYQTTIINGNNLNDNCRSVHLLKHGMFQIPREIDVAMYDESEMNVDDGDDECHEEDVTDVEAEEEERALEDDFDSELDQTIIVKRAVEVEEINNTEDVVVKINENSNIELLNDSIESQSLPPPPPSSSSSSQPSKTVQRKCSTESSNGSNPIILNGKATNRKAAKVEHKKIYSIEQNENISSTTVERRQLRSASLLSNNVITRTLRSSNTPMKVNSSRSNNQNKTNINKPIILNRRLSKFLRINQDMCSWQTKGGKRIKLIENNLQTTCTTRSMNSSNNKQSVNVLNGKTIITPIRQITAKISTTNNCYRSPILTRHRAQKKQLIN